MINILKRNNLLLAFFGLYVLTVVLGLLELDKQYYQETKRDIITENFDQYIVQKIGDKRLASLKRLAVNLLRSNRPIDEERMLALINEIMAEDNIIWRIGLKPAGEPARSLPGARELPLGEIYRIDVQQREKIARHNRFSNSLILRDFTDLISTEMDVYGHLLVYYTTPADDPVIEELTARYRWYALFIVVILTLLSGTVALRLLLPLRSVTNSLEVLTPDRTRLIRRPKARLETLYNRMALDAVLARVQGQLRDEIGRNPQMTGWEVVQFVCRRFRDQIDLPLVACLELLTEGPGLIRQTGVRVIAGDEALVGDEEALAEVIATAVPRDGRTEAGIRLHREGRTHDHGIYGALKMINDPDRTGIRYLFAIVFDFHSDESSYASLQSMLDQLSALVDSGLQTLSLRNQLLVQERGRANISLSRNLGHDLTNIIATSKLELMALDRLLGRGEVPQDAVRRDILSESLQGLLRSVRFMQETVNLYRAYAFLHHPVLETQDANQLVEDTLELFMMSVSAKIELRRELDKEAPRFLVDPRLFKLALFNLFSNALEAIRKGDPDHNAHGWIRIMAGRAPEGGLRLAVEDSGQGILNRKGEKAESHEIEKIFELGYTSRRVSGSQGEGLGLNWVRTIIEDLHGGAIRAENSTEGGACFIMTFPSLEAAMSKAGEEE